MLLETMKALILAGNQALQAACGLQVRCESVSQIRQGSVTFPTLGMVKIVRGSLQKIHLGCNSELFSVLAERVGPNPQEDGVDALLNRFLEFLLQEMEGRNPKGEVRPLDIGTTTLFTRGVRSFGFRLETDLGQLYLLAEIPSRLEFEQARGSEFLETMISTYLPRDWMDRERIDSPSLIDGFLVLLRKAEGDLELEFPRGDGEYSIHSGLLLENCRVDGKRALKMSVDLARAVDSDPRPGDEIVARFGLRDRSIRFTLPYLGRSSFAVAGEASLDCVLFELPEVLEMDQRRQAFRINIATKIPVEIVDLDSRNDPFSPDFGTDSETLVRGQLVDLSFSGARITGEADGIIPQLAEGSRVLCRLFFPDRPGGHEVQGIIRRSNSKMVGRDQTAADVGIEFLVTPDLDRTAINVIRQFVLTEQRNWLAKRAQVVGGNS